MEHELNGSAGGVFKKVGMKLQTVEAFDDEMLPGHGPDFPGPCFHLGTEGFVDLALRDVDGIGVFFRAAVGQKAHPETGITDDKYGNREDCRDPKQ